MSFNDDEYGLFLNIYVQISVRFCFSFGPWICSMHLVGVSA